MEQSSGPYILPEHVFRQANRVLSILILLALATLIVALTISRLSNNDIWQHLKNGQMILHTHHFQYADPYSCSAAGNPWINEQWFSGIIYYLTYLMGGINGIIYLKSLIILLMTGLILLHCYKLNIPFILFVPLTVLMIFNVGMRFLARTEIFSYVFIAAYFHILMQYKHERATWRLLVLLPLLQIFWSNMHGAFILGVFILATFIGCETIRLFIGRRLASWQQDLMTWERLKPLYVIFGLTLLTCLINPYGLRLLFQPFHVVIENRQFIKTIFEWQSPFESEIFRATYAFDYYMAWMVLLGLSFLVNMRRLDLSNLALSLLFSIMAAEMHRSITFLTIVTCPIICLNFHQACRGLLQPSDRRPKWGLETGGRLVILTLLLPLILTSFKHGYIYEENNSKPFGLGIASNMPVKATEYINANHIKGCCFNSYAYGTYLIFHCFPDTRVTMDSRAEHVYGEEYYRRYQKAFFEVDIFKGILKRFDIAYIILNYHSGNLARHCNYLKKSGKWAMVYFDDACFIYVRRLPPYEELISRDEYRYIHPLLTPKGLRVSKEEIDAVIRECLRNLETNSGFLLSHAILFDLYGAKRDWHKTIEHGNIVIVHDPGNYEACMKLGLAYGHLKNFDAAKEMYLKALRIKPESRAARKALVRIGRKGK